MMIMILISKINISETQEINDLDIAQIPDSELTGNNKIQIPLSTLSHI